MPITFFPILILLAASAAMAEIDPRESLKEVCFGRKNPNCSTVSRHKLTRRHQGKVTKSKKLNYHQYAAARKAIEKFQIAANSGRECQEPVEIADFVGESLVRVQSYCAPTNVVRNLKKRL
jgi:hypothetical protein